MRSKELYEPRREKTGLPGFQQVLTRTELYNHRRLEDCKFEFRRIEIVLSV